MEASIIAAPIGKRNPGATRFFEAAIAAGVFLISLLFVRYALGTVFRTWDDEGCMLLSLRSYLAGHRLYAETYTQYGPFPFYFQAFWFRLLNLPVTHDAGRLLTFLTWVASAMLTGAFAYRVSRNLLLACSAGACCIVLGSALANEPGHPQQIVLALLTLSALVTTWLSRRASLSLALLAAIGGALLFTKVNIGTFYLVALAHTCATLLARGRTRAAVVGFTTVGATVLPYLLMRSNSEGIGGYFISATLCIGVTFACAMQLRPKSPIPWRGILGAVVGGTLAVAAIVITAAWKGISFGTLINGVLIAPARQPHAFAVPYYVSSATLCFTVMALACAGILARYAAQGRLAAYSDRVEALRCIIGLVMVAAILSTDASPTGAPHLSWAVPFLPLVLIMPSGKRSWHEIFPRLFLASLASMQYLGQYPVAGSQVSIAASPALLCGLLCIADGAGGLTASFHRFGIPGGDRLLPGTAVCLLVLVGGGMWQRKLPPRFFPYPGSHLSGSGSLHLAPEVEARFEFLTRSVRRNCDALFTMPGMGSFNFWSGLPTPDASNLTNWMPSLPPGAQQRIVRILQADSSACVIYNADNVRFWHTTQESISASPLAAYILGDMHRIAERDGYEIRVHPNRRVPWIE
jgi:hypothetical protein